MTAEPLIQVKLRSGTCERTCWVDRHVKVGDMLTLKNSEDGSVWWKVEDVYDHAVQPERGWHVGGM